MALINEHFLKLQNKLPFLRHRKKGKQLQGYPSQG